MDKSKQPKKSEPPAEQKGEVAAKTEEPKAVVPNTPEIEMKTVAADKVKPKIQEDEAQPAPIEELVEKEVKAEVALVEAADSKVEVK